MGLHAYEFGPADGRPLLALHGLTSYGGRWREVAGLLPAFRVYGPDLRGHGRSPYEPPWTLEQHAIDVLGVLDGAGVDRADVVGHSFGGAVAVALARLTPHRVRRMVLLDPSMAVPPAVALSHAMRELDVPSYPDRDAAALERSAHWPESASDRVPDEVREHLAQGEDGRWRWRYNVAMAVSAFSELARPDVAPPPGVPTLVVRATQGSIPPEQVAAWQSAPGVELSVAELHCGHQVYLELPVETAAVIGRFLEA
jgi:lipase